MLDAAQVGAVEAEQTIDPELMPSGDVRSGEHLDDDPESEPNSETVVVGARGDIDRSLAILTIIEAVQENPAVVIAAQLRRAKDELMSEMKSSGVEYEERMERLAKVEPPRPLKDWMYGDFNNFRAKHPWVGGDTVKPKSVVRDLFERAMTFGEYIQLYGLRQSEGAVLRYLSDVYKGLTQNVPAEAGSDELDEIVHLAGTLVRQVDSSLIDEWERLQNPDDDRCQCGRWPTGRDRHHDRRQSVPHDGPQRGIRLDRGVGASTAPGQRRRGSRHRGVDGRLLGRVRLDRDRW